MELCVIETKVRGLISKEDGQLHRQVPQDIFSTCSLKIKGLQEDIAAGGCGGNTQDVDPISDSDWICPDKEYGNKNFARGTSCNRCGREETPKAKMMEVGGSKIGKTLQKRAKC